MPWPLKATSLYCNALTVGSGVHCKAWSGRWMTLLFFPMGACNAFLIYLVPLFFLTTPTSEEVDSFFYFSFYLPLNLIKSPNIKNMIS